MLIVALAALVASQAIVVAATLSVPVLATAIAPGLDVLAEVLGFHTAAVFATASVFAPSSPKLISRYGPIGVSQATLLLSALGLAAAVWAGAAGLILSAVLFGAAYAQSNTASGLLLSRLVTDRNRNLIFSIKQTSVPLGGMLAGLGLPWLAGVADWGYAMAVLAGISVLVALGCIPARARFDVGSGRSAAAPPRILPLLRIDPTIRAMAIAAGLFASVQFGLSALIVTYLAKSSGLTLQSAGLTLSVSMVLAVATRIGLGAIADRVSARTVLIAIGALISFAALTLVFTTLPSLTVAATVVIMTAVFSWNGLFLAEMARLAKPEAVSTATAAGMLAVFIGGAIAPAIFSTLATTALGYAAVFVLAALAAAYGCFTLAVTKTR